MGWRTAGGFFEEAGVALEEEDVEEEVEGEGSEVEEGGEESPVLCSSGQRLSYMGFLRGEMWTIPGS